jgi:hypothetical protein
MGRKPELQAFGPIKPCPGQREELPDAPFKSRQIPAATYIGKQADAGFGHGEAGIFGRHAETCRLADTDAAAHGDPVHEGDYRLRVSEQQMVELIFVVEKLPSALAIVVDCRIAQEGDIAAGAEPASLGMVDDDAFDRVVILPLQQRLGHRVDHRQGQRMDRARAIEAYKPRMALDSSQDIVCHRRPYAVACRLSR